MLHCFSKYLAFNRLSVNVHCTWVLDPCSFLEQNVRIFRLLKMRELLSQHSKQNTNHYTIRCKGHQTRFVIGTLAM